MAFLHVCDCEGVSVKHLAYLCGLSVASTSRFVHALDVSVDGNAASERGLVRVMQHPEDGRRRSVFLTERGRQLRDEIDALFTSPRRSNEDGGS